MTKFLHKINKHENYSNNVNENHKFNITLCEDEYHLHYDKWIDPYNGYDYIEIGGLKWATMNVGANNITDYGLYFQWGDTQGYNASQIGNNEGQKSFSEDDCIYYNDGSYTKYNSTDGKITLEPIDDAVSTAWGGNWRTPTMDEYVTLGNEVNTAWTADYQGSGIAGLICTDKTDSSKVLFFPAAGRYFLNSDSNTIGNYGFYLSSTLYSSNIKYNYSLLFGSSDLAWNNTYGVRYYGYSLRGVAY